MTRDAGLPEESSVIITSVQIPSETVTSAVNLSSSLIILPISHTEDGKGVYGQSTVFLVKELKSEGIDAAYLDSSEFRLFDVKKGQHQIVFEMAFALMRDMAVDSIWAAIKVYLLKSLPPRQPMNITYSKISNDGASESWNVAGPIEGTLRAVDKFLS